MCCETSFEMGLYYMVIGIGVKNAQSSGNVLKHKHLVSKENFGSEQGTKYKTCTIVIDVLLIYELKNVLSTMGHKVEHNSQYFNRNFWGMFLIILLCVKTLFSCVFHPEIKTVDFFFYYYIIMYCIFFLLNFIKESPIAFAFERIITKIMSFCAFVLL